MLCLSKGNAYNLGSLREKELVQSAASFGIDSVNITVVDDPNLQDGLHAEWEICSAVGYIEEAMNRVFKMYKMDIDLVTFDSGGVSGHANHIALYNAVETMKKTKKYLGYGISVIFSPLERFR